MNQSHRLHPTLETQDPNHIRDTLEIIEDYLSGLQAEAFDADPTCLAAEIQNCLNFMNDLSARMTNYSGKINIEDISFSQQEH